jgi:predicted transposase/invertase (TIGR01784 family)
MATNVKFKSTVFSTLFSNPDVLRELYCALKGVTLPADIPVTVNTLENVLFMDMMNDVSFEIGGKLVVLIEHQSTINPNMAFRLLLYIARVYEKITGDKNIYASRLIPIPRPEFFVPYNGAAPYPDEKTIKLSDAFMNLPPFDLLKEESPVLELAVKVLNINAGKNEAVAQRCATLAEYSAFVAKVRELETELGDRETAIVQAVRYCRDHEILKEFLKKNAAEVLNMLMTEWNMDDALDFRYAEGIQEGIEKGIQEGMEKGMMEGIEKGIQEGLEKGIQEGMEKGIEREREEIARNALAQGVPLETILAITGLDEETIKNIQAKL